ncbi:MAG TPA: hypothetical protein VEO01_34205, partial [Pseudonocardiaceae bacterium]|nr:hypothetical protein [Pseudonocardiaceae bacterium]
AIGEAGISAGYITAAVVALVTMLGDQVKEMTTLHGQAVDESTFPGGRWPNPNTGSYNYAS